MRLNDLIHTFELVVLGAQSHPLCWTRDLVQGKTPIPSKPRGCHLFTNRPVIGHKPIPEGAAECWSERLYHYLFQHIILLCPTTQYNEAYQKRPWMWSNPDIYIVDPGSTTTSVPSTRLIRMSRPCILSLTYCWPCTSVQSVHVPPLWNASSTTDWRTDHGQAL